VPEPVGSIPPPPRGEDGDPVAVLTLRHVSKRFGGTVALDDVSFECRAGEVHALAGENGAGKSTLIKVISGVHVPDTGEIEIDEKVHPSLTTAQARRLGIRVIYQEFNLFPELSVAENVYFGIEPRTRWKTLDSRAMRRGAREVLGRLHARIDVRRLVGELSVAQQQLVEIAKALVVESRFLIMDEPSAALAEQELDELFAIIRRLEAEGVGIIYISHRLEEVFAIADRVTVLKDGRHVGTWNVGKVTRERLVEAMVGRALSGQFPPRHPRGQRVLLRVRDLSGGEDGGGRVENVSFDLHEGEILGIGGMVGSGRSRLARAIMGMDRRSSGSVLLDGDPLPASPAAAIRRGLVMVPENRKVDGLFVDKTVRFNVSLPNLAALVRGWVVGGRREREYVIEAIERADVRPRDPERPVEALSGGNQQKVVLAKWLAMKPSVVIVDEPTHGIDVGARAEIYQRLRELTRQGVGVMMISSELPELLGMSDRILVMREGRVAGELPADEAREKDVMLMAMGAERVAG
jgi:ABC-type sugar transport system ATPase subunit